MSLCAVLSFAPASRADIVVHTTDLETWNELDDSVPGQPVETEYVDAVLGGDPEIFHRVTRQP